MIVLINGGFGVGKTTTALLLLDRIAPSLLYDPEKIGFAVRAILRDVAPADDFQDYPEWRALTVDAARQLRAHRNHALIVPMTVLRRDYFTEITDGLRAIDPDLRLLRLTASEETLRRRILARPDNEGPHEWALSHLPAVLRAMADPLFGVEVLTENRTPAEVAELTLVAIEDHASRPDLSRPRPA
jgi:gluconate kinase